MTSQLEKLMASLSLDPQRCCFVLDDDGSQRSFRLQELDFTPPTMNSRFKAFALRTAGEWTIKTSPNF
jgi:hypothetical protein